MEIQKAFEKKVDMPLIRQWLVSLCISSLGKHLVSKMRLMNDCKQIKKALSCVSEMRWLLRQEETVTTVGYHDITHQLERLRVNGSYLIVEELLQLRQILTSTQQTVNCVRKKSDENDSSKDEWFTPTLASMSKDVQFLPFLLQVIERVMTKNGEIRDDASEELFAIRQNIHQETRNMSGRMQRILSSLQKDNIIDIEAAAVVRDGILMLPVPSMNRNKVLGIVHGESQGGNLVYIEPEEVVQANARLRKLISEEQTEITRILKQVADEIRPYKEDVINCLHWLAFVDFTRAKACLAEEMYAVEPAIVNKPIINWAEAYHPLLRKKRQEQGEKCVPLTIRLCDESYMLVISGPNAGGKSVCLKTIGLLQCMLQYGLSVPVSKTSKAGVFHKMMIDIGDDQSIDDELSTYSSHLRHLKRMMQDGDEHTLLLIDELGGGTEPTAGGAIAEVVLGRLLQQHCRTVVTTHFQNLKHFASTHHGVENGAMLYDDVNMCPLYELVQGHAGSSFALDIARRVGFPPELINEVKANVGEAYVKQERFLHDVYRDRRYWNNKRKSVSQLEKQLQERIEKYSLKRQRLIDERDNILHQARLQAEKMLSESNRLIESTIREIRESAADKEQTKAARKTLEEKQTELLKTNRKSHDDSVRVRKRKEKKEEKIKSKKISGIRVGSSVKLRGMGGIGVIESLDDSGAVVVTGNIRMRVDRDRFDREFELSHDTLPSASQRRPGLFVGSSSLTSSIYSTSIDIRGERAEEALAKVERFVDETVVRGMHEVRILHGKGDGILSSVIRKYLADRKEVKSFRDEHVDFGGAGITVVEME